MSRIVTNVAAGAAFAALTLQGPAGCGPNVSDRNIKTIPLAEVRTYFTLQRQDAEKSLIVLIDPRAARDYNAAHIPGARNMHLPDFKRDDSRDPELESFDRIVVYGQHPGDYYAPGVTKRLLELGYERVYFYSGGIDEWARLYNVDSIDDPSDG